MPFKQIVEPRFIQDKKRDLHAPKTVLGQERAKTIFNPDTYFKDKYYAKLHPVFTVDIKQHSLYP